jgi:hypothetical protein
MIMKKGKRSVYHRFTASEKSFIAKWYPKVQTCCMAHILGVDVLKIEQFAYRNNTERWARKSKSTLSRIRLQASALGVAARKKK